MKKLLVASLLLCAGFALAWQDTGGDKATKSQPTTGKKPGATKTKEKVHKGGKKSKVDKEKAGTTPK